MTDSAPFDHHSAAHAVDNVGVYRRLRQGAGHLRTEAHGGYTVFGRYAEITAITNDHAEFSSALDLPGDEGYGGGITLPHNPAARQMSLAEMDGDDWRRVRKLMNPLFTPMAVERFSGQIRAITNDCIDRICESGSGDLVLDLCSPVPAIVTLAYLGMDTSEWERYAVPVHSSTFTPRDPSNPAWQKIAGDFQWIFDQIRAEIAERRRSPKGGDLLDAMMSVQPQDGGLDDDEVFDAVYTVIAAGVDTTTSLLSTALWHFDQHSEDWQRLIDDRSLLKPACEEILRFYSPSQGGARTVTCPVDVGGVHLERGERVFISWASGSRDEEAFERADEFVVDRQPNRHLGFGYGIHRCIGLHLARQEFRIVIDEVLNRMPDYKIDRSATELYPDVGLMYGYQQMPAVFTPTPAMADA